MIFSLTPSSVSAGTSASVLKPAATIAERYRGYDASGANKAGQVEATADEYWRDARFSISRVAERPGCIVSLL